MRRGEIWWADLPIPTGSEPGYSRPVIIISSDEFNNTGLKTATVAVITSNIKYAGAPGNVRINRRESGLSKTSVINVSQIITLNRNRLRNRGKKIPHKLIKQLDNGIRWALGV